MNARIKNKNVSPLNEFINLRKFNLPDATLVRVVLPVDKEGFRGVL